MTVTNHPPYTAYIHNTKFSQFFGIGAWIKYKGVGSINV